MMREAARRLLAVPHFACTRSRYSSVANPASEALRRVVAAPAGGAHTAAAACREFIASLSALDAESLVEWWSERALAEEEAQLEALSRALPRGGRVAPQLLDSVRPTEVEASEAMLRQLPAALPAAEGLPAALAVRAGVREALVAVGPHAPASFALERLDRRMREVLSLWFAPGMLRVELVQVGAASPEVLQALADVASSAAPGFDGDAAAALSSPSRRAFVLTHAQMELGAAPLMVAHASLLGEMPGTLRDAVEPTGGVAAKVACLWALGAPRAPGGAQVEALRGLGLGQVLRRAASEALRQELVATGSVEDAPVVALARLSGFREFLLQCRVWERTGLETTQAEILRRAAQGPEDFAGPGEVRFVDIDGDNVRFALGPWADGYAHALTVEFGGGAPRRIVKLAVAPDSQAVRFFVEPGPEAFQIDVNSDVATSGVLANVQLMGEAVGLLPNQVREPLMHFAYEYITRRGPDGRRSAEPVSHFHLAGGAAMNALHWGADDSAFGLVDSLGIMSSFVYRGASVESDAAQAYADDGLNAATFTAS
mmetsp:Transcript_107926/g.311041  ORF Transcript_107926/g.311041 Transcript_107926/m.311041 type:complete len:544 (-) Transcript_107926:95-1726(-)